MRTSEPGFEDGTLNPYVVRPDEVQDGDYYGYKVIAVVWKHWNGWSAYRGPTGWNDDKVVDQGDFVSEAVAEFLFPALYNSGRSYGEY